jgi:hypothetical protein
MMDTLIEQIISFVTKAKRNATDGTTRVRLLPFLQPMTFDGTEKKKKNGEIYGHRSKWRSLSNSEVSIRSPPFVPLDLYQIYLFHSGQILVRAI